MTVASAPRQPIEVPAAAGGSTGEIVPSLPGVADGVLAASFDVCRRVTRARARNFYYGLRLTPEPRRSAIYAIYAWMRAADDEADAAGPLHERRRRLAAYRRRTADALALAAAEHHADWSSFTGAWPAFAATVRAYPIDPAHFSAMLDGLEEDLEHAGYPDDAALERYCYRVASTVGLVCIAIWGLRPGANPADARLLAVRRGQAFQRTNILRDYAQDFDASPRRTYIPADAFQRHGISPDDLRRWRHPDRCRALVLEQAARARDHYEASAPLLRMIDPDCAPTLWAMTTIYSDLLAIIERDPARIVAPRRIRLPASRKALIALRATVRSRTSGW